jgi:hypothetical protein
MLLCVQDILRRFFPRSRSIGLPVSHTGARRTTQMPIGEIIAGFGFARFTLHRTILKSNA